MNAYMALVKREVLDGKNGYFLVPFILAGITLFLIALSALGFGNMIQFDGMTEDNIGNLADAIRLAVADSPEELSAVITIGYWSMSLLAWVAFPFVVFFSLLGALYEERRDRSILFWKSMPVSDWQEVLAKFFTPVIIGAASFFAIAFASQLVIAMVFSLIMIVQGGPVLEMWPIGLMITSWFIAVAHYLLWTLWALPILAWVLFVSAFASRLPFLWAILIPAVMVVVEGLFLKTSYVAQWIGTHIGGWQDRVFGNVDVEIDSPRELINIMFNGVHLQALAGTLSSAQFWFGFIVAGGFVLGAIQFRKRML